MTPDLTERIADVLAKHQEGIAHGGPVTAFTWQAMCECGWEAPYLNTDRRDAEIVHARHVAEAVVEELNFKDTLVSADSILSLLQEIMVKRPGVFIHYRDLVDSDLNRDDVKNALDKIMKLTR
jgi:hypothetical protein